MNKQDKNYAFIDGSFNPKTNTYGYGGFLVDQNGKKHSFNAAGYEKNLVNMRNVAGEIMGAEHAIKLAQKLGMSKLTIFHDYEGVSAWPLGKWKCRKKETKEYADFVLLAIACGLDIYFSHVKGHSGIEGNEEADRLAKSAVGLSMMYLPSKRI